MVDEVEHAVIGPLEVLEDQDHHAVLGDAFEVHAPGREQRVAVRTLIGLRCVEAKKLEQARLDPAALRLVGDVLVQRGAELGAGRGRVIGIGDRGAAADHLGQRPEADALAVRRGSALVPVDDLGHAVDILEELPDQPALADAALADDRYQPRPPLGPGGDVELLQHPQLRRASHERRFQLIAAPHAAALCNDAQGAERRHRGGLALEELLPGRLEGDRIGRGLHGGLAHQDGARRRHRLEAAGRVDEVAGHHTLVAGAEGHRRLAGQDARPQLEVGPDLVAQRRNGRDQVERAAHRPLGVILEGRRRAPHGHDRVPDELLHRPAVGADDLRGRREVSAQQVPHLLGVARLRQGGEADEVGEQDRYQPPLSAGRLGRPDGLGDHQCIAALAAEPRPRRVRRGARRAGDRQRRSALAAEFPARLVRGPTRGTVHWVSPFGEPSIAPLVRSGSTPLAAWSRAATLSSAPVAGL